ncbi:type 4a pilus biogenesis protein PilO [Patescibacteria group bacterium]|nr:type 4a pilus biogenesis protein PilO [Patescibacteria group bacterium]
MKKYKTIIYILIALAAFSALTYFVFLPQIKNSFLLFTQNAIKKEEVLNLEEKKISLNNLKKEEKEAEELTNTLASMLPDKKDAGRFMIEVEALAQENRIDLTDIKFSEEKKTASKSASTVKGASTSKFKEMVFELIAKGSYADATNFIKGLEKINRAITIERCDLSESKNIIQATIKGKAYYQND